MLVVFQPVNWYWEILDIIVTLWFAVIGAEEPAE